MNIFWSTRYPAVTSRYLLQHECVLEKSAPEADNSLEEDIKSVQDFHKDPDIIRCCPGAKDTVSLRTGTDGKVKTSYVSEVK
jgi:hypothetical protein